LLLRESGVRRALKDTINALSCLRVIDTTEEVGIGQVDDLADVEVYQALTGGETEVTLQKSPVDLRPNR
jgi:hypothetical protein